jgi:hypothetical protein
VGRARGASERNGEADLAKRARTSLRGREWKTVLGVRRTLARRGVQVCQESLYSQVGRTVACSDEKGAEGPVSGSRGGIGPRRLPRVRQSLMAGGGASEGHGHRGIPSIRCGIPHGESPLTIRPNLPMCGENAEAIFIAGHLRGIHADRHAVAAALV